jgi:DNA-binding XRE family transcriptional regulator
MGQLSDREIRRLRVLWKMYRAAYDLTQEQAGNLAGLTKQNASDFEGGATPRDPNQTRIVKQIKDWQDNWDRRFGDILPRLFSEETDNSGIGTPAIRLPSFMDDAPMMEQRLLEALREAYKLNSPELAEEAQQLFDEIELSRSSWESLEKDYRVFLRKLGSARPPAPHHDHKKMQEEIDERDKRKGPM